MQHKYRQWATTALIINGTIFVGVTLYWFPVLMVSLVFWLLTTAEG